MNDNAKRTAELAGLAELLDTHGGNPERWPADRRAAFERLIAADPEARRLAAEAQALDRVLTGAPAAGAVQPLVLSKLILDKVRAERGNSGGRPGLDGMRTGNRSASPVLTRRAGWASAGVLAASFVFGIVLGGSDLGAPYVEDLASAAGLADTSAVLSELIAGDGIADGELL